jgi:hypothetical protein
MINGDLLSVTISTERSLAGLFRAERKAAQIAAGRCQAIPMDSETQPYLARGRLPQELCAAIARHGDTAPKAGLLLSSDIETE